MVAPVFAEAQRNDQPSRSFSISRSLPRGSFSGAVREILVLLGVTHWAPPLASRSDNRTASFLESRGLARGLGETARQRVSVGPRDPFRRSNAISAIREPSAERDQRDPWTQCRTRSARSVMGVQNAISAIRERRFKRDQRDPWTQCRTRSARSVNPVQNAISAIRDGSQRPNHGLTRRYDREESALAECTCSARYRQRKPWFESSEDEGCGSLNITPNKSRSWPLPLKPIHGYSSVAVLPIIRMGLIIRRPRLKLGWRTRSCLENTAFFLTREPTRSRRVAESQTARILPCVSLSTCAGHQADKKKKKIPPATSRRAADSHCGYAVTIRSNEAVPLRSSDILAPALHCRR